MEFVGPAISLRVAAADWKVSDSTIARSSVTFLGSLNQRLRGIGKGVGKVLVLGIKG